jgi:hypothetical protein
MLNASPLMHGEGNGLLSISFVPARAAAKDNCCAESEGTVFVIGTEACGTIAADCTVAENGAASDTHGHWHA